MTDTEAYQLGYRVIEASTFEVGLVKNGIGIRTWWNSTFKNEIPTLDNPVIQEAIRITEELNRKDRHEYK